MLKLLARVKNMHRSRERGKSTPRKKIYLHCFDDILKKSF